jgi:hypothetical protein
VSCALFLDLEDTIIDEWATRNFLRTRDVCFVRDCINHRNRLIDLCLELEREHGTGMDINRDKIDCLGLFSYAVSHDADKQIFVEEMKSDIERMLCLKFDPDYVLTVDQIRLKWIQRTNIQVKPNDAVDFQERCGNKAMTFFNVAPLILKPQHKTAYLLDDTVGDLDLHMRKSGIRLCTRSLSRDREIGMLL